MKLDADVNFIVSGLERSGTSMMMQILNSADLPTSFDDSRLPDNNNPKGYYELEGGKIINKLIEGSFPFDAFKGKFIKITAYGLRYLPLGKYKIIYSERDIEEILDSMEKMIGKKDDDREITRETFVKLNDLVKNHILEREDMDILLINYNNILSNPEENINKILDFLGIPGEILDKMMEVIDSRLYRNRRT